MAIFDAVGFVVGLFDIVAYWRFFLPTAIGFAVALGVYYLTGESPASAAVASAIGFAGVCTGLIWQVAGSKRRAA